MHSFSRNVHLLAAGSACRSHAQKTNRGALCAVFGLLLLTSACENEDDPRLGTMKPPATVGGDDGGGSDAASAGGADASGGGPDGGSNDSGSPGASDGGSASPDASSGAAGDGGASTDAGGPLSLPDPTVLGPYAVKELDNVGMGFENPIDATDRAPGGSFCNTFVSLFSSDPMVVKEFSEVPTTYRMDLYTLYYPEGGAPGQRFPVLSWANGTCAHTRGYGELIKHVVSHGFIVIAPHSRFTGNGSAQKRGIDWVFAEDTAMSSPLFGRVNKELVGVFGHSQGGGSTGVASGDPRVKSSVLMHGGSGSMLHAPALFLTGDGDINPSGVRSAYDGVRVAAAFGSLKDSDHITMMSGRGSERMAPEVLAWFRYTLLNDEVGKKWYVGSDCLLCKDAEWVYAQKNLK